jgi:hypothetical protein
MRQDINKCNYLVHVPKLLQYRGKRNPYALTHDFSEPLNLGFSAFSGIAVHHGHLTKYSINGSKHKTVGVSFES